MSNVPEVPIPMLELFTPVPSGVGSDVGPSPDATTWLSALLDEYEAIGLDTTAWEPGGPERTLIKGFAVACAQEDVVISLQNQGGFLDYAATGTVTYTTVNGVVVTVPVTPDPSDPSQNATGALGWLDVVGQARFGVKRKQAKYATGTLAIANTSTSSTSSYTPGSYHVSNPTTGATFATTANLTVPPSALAGAAANVTGVTGSSVVAITTGAAHGLSSGQVVYLANLNGVTLSRAFAAVTVTSSTTFQLQGVTATGAWTSGGTVYLCTLATFQADVVGPGSSSPPGAVTQTVTQNPGVVVFNLASWNGGNYEKNGDYAARCKLSLAAKSPNGPEGAYKYFALTASDVLAAEDVPVTLKCVDVIGAKITASPLTGLVTSIVAGESPASTTLGAAVVGGIVDLPVTNVTAASPIQVTTGSAHGLSNGDYVTIADVDGVPEANGTFTATVVDATNFTLDGSTGTGAYVSGGTVEAGDLGEIDRVIQENAVPQTDTATTVSATAFPLTIAGTVLVPAARVATYKAAVQIAVTNYLASLDIGGLVLPPATTGVVDYSALEALLFSAGQVGGQATYVIAVPTLTIDGGAGPVSTDVAYPTTRAQAVLAALNLTVTGV